MTFYSYSVLTASKQAEGSIKNWTNKTDLPSAAILDEAEQYIYERLRAREMQTSTTGTMTIGTATIALPARYRTPLPLHITGAVGDVIGGGHYAEVKHKLLEEVERSFQFDGDGVRVNLKPQIYYTDGANINFESPPDKAYTYRFAYYQALTSLSGANETNFLTDRYPRMLRAACLMIANEWLKQEDDRAYWGRVCDGGIIMATIEADQERGRGLEADPRTV